MLSQMLNNQMLNNQMMYEDCYNRLPCGICRLTNMACPKCGVTITTMPTFDFSKVTCTGAPSINTVKDSITYSTNTTEVNS